MADMSYQKIVVDTSMLKVMRDCRPRGTVDIKDPHGIGLSDPSVRQQQVSQLQHGGHMYTACKAGALSTHMPCKVMLASMYATPANLVQYGTSFRLLHSLLQQTHPHSSHGSCQAMPR